MAYIFLLELIVDDLNIFAAQNADWPSDQTKTNARDELCVRLQLAGLARCEVCEKDFGSSLDLERTHKTGENCLFAYDQAMEMGEEEPVFRISAHTKGADGAKKLLGFWEESGRETIETLKRAYDQQRAATGSCSSGSKESLQSCRSFTNGRRQRPVSNTFKAMHPLRGEAEEAIVGCVVVTIRLSCLGPIINQKVLFGGRGGGQQQQPYTCYKMEDEPMIRCATVEEPEPEDGQLIAPRASLATIAETAVEGKEEQQPYDEYAAELNGNAICIRVEKDAHIAVNIDGEENEDGCGRGCWTSLTLPDGVYGLKEEYVQREANACKLPVVRGTLKYPAYHWAGDFMLAKKTTPVTIDDFRKRPDATRTVGLQAFPERVEQELAGIEICRKGWHDPNVDVFVLKLGKHPPAAAGGGAPNPRHQIEVELRTPKGPSREIRPKETRGVQVVEDEFETSQAAAAAPRSPTTTSAPTPGAPDAQVKGKKTKPAAKKGKKK